MGYKNEIAFIRWLYNFRHNLETGVWPAYNRCIAGYCNKNFFIESVSKTSLRSKKDTELQRGRYTRETVLKAERSLKSSLFTFLYLKSMNILFLYSNRY